MMNEEPNGGAMAARVADAFAEEDAKRRDYLDWMVKRGGTCRGCGATVADAQLQEHPGVCGTCHRRKHIKPLELPAPPDATPKPREETTMRARNAGYGMLGAAQDEQPEKKPSQDAPQIDPWTAKV